MTPDQGLIVAYFTVSIPVKAIITANNAYFTKGSSRVLTTEGRQFKSEITAVVAQATLTTRTPWKVAIDAVYKFGGSCRLTLVLHDNIINEAWRVGGSTTKTGLPRMPYQKKDTDGIKLIVDAIADGTGIDDACNLDLVLKKRQNKTPCIDVLFEVFE